MEITIPLEFDRQFASLVIDKLDRIKPAVEGVMAQEFYDITQANFGKFGVARTIPWVALSPAYAKRVKRTYATLEVTGRLADSVRKDGNTVSVSDDEVPYALIHQFGGVNQPMPKRPYFPIDDNEQLNPIAENRINSAGAEELARLLEGLANS